MATSAQDIPRITPRSALRHRPIYADTQDVVVAAPRASRRGSSQGASTTRMLPRPSTASSYSLMFTMGASMLATLLLIMLGQWLWASGQTAVDDLRFGRPRTFQVDAYVGHETEHTPSHFLALNQHGRIEIIELPCGDPTHARIYIGPQIAGNNAELTPVTLTFVRNPLSKRVDMLVHFAGTQVLYHNEQGGFIPV